MPNFDGGHYFLTALSPVLADPCVRDDGSVTSPVATLRETLASLPTAAQSAACIDSKHGSPFARCDRTHLARFVVIDQPAFNGRDTRNSLVDAIHKTDLLAHQPVDSLTRAWLLLAVDFDAGEEADHGLHDYLARLWTLAPAELHEVYRHCHGFDEVKDGDGFACYVTRCQIETTMPFNDYWSVPLKLPTLSLGALAGLIAAIFAGVLLLAWGATGLLGISPGWIWLGVPVGLALGLWGAYRFVGGRGLRPFPAAPGADLRNVLKALYLQQQFARFAIAGQGLPAASLHAAFGEFVAMTRPGDISAPTQAPGVIRS